MLEEIAKTFLIKEDAQTFLRRCCIMASIAVIWARISDEVYITSIGILHILLPASMASSTPFGVRGTSTQPVNRFFSFHRDSPCRINIRALSPATTQRSQNNRTYLYALNLRRPKLNVANGQFSQKQSNKQTSNHHTSSFKWKSLKLLDFFGVWPLLPSDGRCIGSMTEDCELDAHTKPSFRLPEPQLPFT